MSLENPFQNEAEKPLTRTVYESESVKEEKTEEEKKIDPIVAKTMESLKKENPTIYEEVATVPNMKELRNDLDIYGGGADISALKMVPAEQAEKVAQAIKAWKKEYEISEAKIKQSKKEGKYPPADAWDGRKQVIQKLAELADF